MSDKIRLDLAVFEAGLAPSRERAKALIMAGQIFVNNQKCDKPGTSVKTDDNIELRGENLPFVSRGGFKLDKAVKCFDLNLDGLCCVDIGASTGGFTDVMLQNKAAKVYAVDVGYGQLAWKLRTDNRVVNLERCNFRYVTKEQIPDDIDFASADVAFISLKKIIPALLPLLKENAHCVFLIKPQFEAGKEKVGKNGVVRDKSVHIEVVEDLVSFFIESGFSIEGLNFSPIKGPQGNIEYLAYLKYDNLSENRSDIEIKDLVENSHNELS